MGKIDLYQIVLDNSVGTFYPGQNVSGKVILHLNAPFKMNGIFIHFQGKAFVYWSQTRSYYDSSQKRTVTYTSTYTDSEVYFNVKDPLLNMGNKNEEVLNSGRHEYPFTMTLPKTLPTSFEGTFGYIRYVCSSNISRSWKRDPKCKMPFTVISVMDLNQVPNAAVPVNETNCKKQGVLFFKSGQIKCTVSLNKSGFVPGESIYISSDIQNASTNSVKKTVAILASHVNYTAHKANKYEFKEVCRLERGEIKPFGNDQWTNLPLKVPALPPTGLQGCKIIDLKYSIEFVVDAAGLLSRDLKISLPLTIGNVPLQTDFSNFLPPVDVSPMASFPYSTAPPFPTESRQYTVSASEPTAPPPEYEFSLSPYPDMPPPSYEESCYGRVNIREEDDDDKTLGQLDFAPYYLYYNTK